MEIVIDDDSVGRYTDSFGRCIPDPTPMGDVPLAPTTN